MVRVAQVIPGSIADELSLQIGSRIVRINAQPVRDVLDLRFLEAEERLELEVAPQGESVSTIFEIEKEGAEPLGIVPASDPVRECANKCVFCFIDGNPPAARKSLRLRDDDFRLSFTYGSYVTLTNLGPRGFQRLIDQRISPLYVSVHATEPDVRMRLLGVQRGGEIVAQLARLTSAGIQAHTQVVLCPEWNDGEHLERTLDALWELGPGILSVSVVPVGLSRYNVNRPVRLLTPREAEHAIAQVDGARGRATAERGVGWAYAGDELFLLAGRPVPGKPYYDESWLQENGVGAVRHFLDEFAAWKDAPDLTAQRVAVVTGTRMLPFLERLAPELARATGAEVEVFGVRNDFFGPTVTTAGLLAGGDILAALGRQPAFDIVALPADVLNEDLTFIDDLPLDRFATALNHPRIVRGATLPEALSPL